MAGIGFQLKNLFKGNSFFWRMKAFAYSSVVIAGPMILCILLITLAQFSLGKLETPFSERELFLGGTLYSFVFSQLLTGGFTMVFSRYLADQIYLEKKENVLSSLYGVLALNLLIGGFTGLIFYLFSPLALPFKIVTYLFFMELVMVWLLSIYISALKKYMQLISGFAIGVLTSGVLILTGYLLFGLNKATIVFAWMDTGFFVIILFFFRSIKQHFPKNNQRYFDFLIYLQKYPSLFLIGFLYTLGLYGHSFIVWFSPLKVVAGHTFAMAPLYDVPVFYAYLTILPSMVMFVVSVETSFYEQYQKFYGLVLGSATLREIKEGQDKMFHVLSREFAFMMEFQLFFTICAISLGTQLLPLSTEQIDIFNIIAVGNFFFIMMFILVQILLYFDDRQGALMVIGCYCTGMLLFTAITIWFGNYGLSCFIAGVIGLGVALARIYHFSRNFGYYTFCFQPLIIKEEKRYTERIAAKLNSLNGMGGNYETKD